MLQVDIISNFETLKEDIQKLLSKKVPLPELSNSYSLAFKG